MPAYHSGNLSKTGRPDFNYPFRPTAKDLTVPVGPRNIMVTSPYKIGATDIRWDNPNLIPQNNGLHITGVNVYRSINNPYGPYEKVNDTPVGVLCYRDETQEQLVEKEDVTPTLRHSIEPDGKWRVWAQHRPVVRMNSNGTTTDNIQDIMVEIDDGSGTFVTVPAFTLSGKTGEVVLISAPTYNQDVEQIIPPRLPWPPGGKVRLTYRYLKHSVLSVLSQRIYYKVATVAVDPNDNSRRLETPIDEAEWRSTADIEEIDYIWREAILRNRWILEQAGERAKVFIRKWMGETCPEYEESHGQSRNDCELCFAPGTKIRILGGWKNIEEITADDSVLSSDENYHKVSRIFERPYTGKLISILPSISTNPLLVTPNHPILVLRGKHKRNRKNFCGPGPICDKFIENGDGLAVKKPNVRLLPSGKWWARAQVGGRRNCGRTALGTFDTREDAVNAILNYRKINKNSGHSLEWNEAGRLNKKDWLTPIWPKEIKDVDYVEIPQQYLKKENSSGPARNGSSGFAVDEEFLWVIGLYIAEGSSGTRLINFALHKKEVEYQNRVMSFFKKYGFNSKLCSHAGLNGKGLGVCVNVYSSSLAKWFPEWLGKKCDKKHIPYEFMNLPTDKLWAVVKGVYDGDGSKRNHEIIQTSEILALQIVEALHRIGEQPLTRKQISRNLTPKGNKRKVAYCVSWHEEGFDHKNRKYRWVYKDKILTQIKKISEIEYSGKVYNLEVEENHSYVANGVLVHNCYGTSYIGGYDGAFEILIAPPEAEKTIDLLDMGLHINYNFMTFTGPFPIINERDVIVRQNNERYVVGPVNYQGSRGAIYQQHFTITYIDEGDIRYKIGVVGGRISIPESTDLYREESGTPGQPLKTPASPVIPLKTEIPRDKILLGRTVTWENITYALIFSLTTTEIIFKMCGELFKGFLS